MKQIIIDIDEKPKDCHACPLNGIYDSVNDMIKRKISCGYQYKDCPLQDVPSRDEARRLIKQVLFEGYDCNIEETLDELGYKEGV